MTRNWLTLLSKYSISPCLSLTVKPSVLRRYCIFVLGFAVAWANLLVFHKGYPFLALLLSLASLLLLWRGAHDPVVGTRLKWDRGQWFFRQGDRQVLLVLLPGSVRLPWLVYASFREARAKQRRKFLLFTDSASPEQLRGLRTRLILEQS